MRVLCLLAGTVRDPERCLPHRYRYSSSKSDRRAPIAERSSARPKLRTTLAPDFGRSQAISGSASCCVLHGLDPQILSNTRRFSTAAPSVAPRLQRAGSKHNAPEVPQQGGLQTLDTAPLMPRTPYRPIAKTPLPLQRGSRKKPRRPSSLSAMLSRAGRDDDDE